MRITPLTILCLILPFSACLQLQNGLTSSNATDNRAATQTSSRDLSVYPVNAIAMDPKDLLWLGTPHSLASFDGQNSRFWYAGDPQDAEMLPSANIRCLFSDHDRTVWIGTEAGLCTYNRFSRFKNFYCEGTPLGPV